MKAVDNFVTYMIEPALSTLVTYRPTHQTVRSHEYLSLYLAKYNLITQC
jgi:hypothetical protein